MSAEFHRTPAQLEAEHDFALRLRSVASAAGFPIRERGFATVVKLVRERVGKVYLHRDDMLAAALVGIRGTNPGLFAPELFGALERPTHD